MPTAIKNTVTSGAGRSAAHAEFASPEHTACYQITYELTDTLRKNTTVD